MTAWGAPARPVRPTAMGRNDYPADETRAAKERQGGAIWDGDLKSGTGTISTDSGVLKATQYSFSTRFESGAGTNPEELIAAAHAGCFSMALSARLGEAKLTPTSVRTTAPL